MDEMTVRAKHCRKLDGDGLAVQAERGFDLIKNTIGIMHSRIRVVAPEPSVARQAKRVYDKRPKE